MYTSLSEKRMAENEVVFRRYNERVGQEIDKLEQLAREDNQLDMLHDVAEPLHFLCECSDENCTARVRLSLQTYGKIHENRQHFVVLPGHDVAEIEEVIAKTDEYWTVLKDEKPRPDATALMATEVDNT